MIPNFQNSSKQILGSSLLFSAQGGWDKEKKEKPAEKIFASPSEGEVEGGDSASPERQNSQSGFSSKKVRILTKRHRQFSIFTPKSFLLRTNPLQRRIF